MNLVHPSAYWTSTNPILEPYQIGVETDTNQWKMGDGLTAWSDLTYAKFPFEYSIATGTDTYATTFGKGLVYTNEFIDYYVGLTLWVKFGNANTGAATLNINSKGAKAIKKNVTTALAAADIKAGGIYELVYDGTNFQINISSGSGGTGDVVGPGSATADDIAVFNGTTGKLIKDGGSKISDLQLRSEKDASGGYAGLTLFKINFKNAANTFISFFTNSNTAARTYTFQDRNGTIADDTDLALKAPLASPALTGNPTAPTQSANDNSTKIATTAYVDATLWTRLILTAGDQTTTAATVQNITALVTPSLTANKRYYFRGQIHGGCNNTGGIKYAVTIPAGATVYMKYNGSTSGVAAFGTSANIASATLSNAFCTENNANRAVIVEGEVAIAGTAGTVQFQFASTTAGQTSTIYQQGTLIEFKQID